VGGVWLSTVSDRGRAGDRVAVVALVALCAVPMLVLAWLRYRLHAPAGDEPHYLIVSQALERYHSLDVQRVYDNRDYAAFFPGPIEPHTSPGPSGRPMPLHSIGGPVLWLLPFVLAGRAGVLAFMVGVSLLIVANVYWLCRGLGVRRSVAVAVGAGFGIGTPVLTYSSLSFVEPIGALVCVYALRVLQMPVLRTRDLLLVSTGLGLLCWVHGRFLLFPPIFLGLLVVRLRREGSSGRRWIAALVPAAGMFVGLLLYHLVVWHTLAVAPNQTNAGAVPFRTNPLPALAGVLFDQEIGVVPNFPVFLLVVPGILVLGARSARSMHLAVGAVVLPYTVIVCSFPAWAGAWSPPARFLVMVLPMLAGYVAVALERAHRAVAVLAAVAVVYGGALTTVALFTPDGGFSAQSGQSPALVLLGTVTRVDLTRFVPSAAVGGQGVLFAVWGAAAVGVTALVVLLGRERRSGSAIRTGPVR
jgi:hypothetical protein